MNTEVDEGVEGEREEETISESITIIARTAAIPRSINNREEGGRRCSQDRTEDRTDRLRHNRIAASLVAHSSL